MGQKYCESPFFYRRRKTREVKVGDIGIGGNNPIRVQSMITTSTRDTEASVAQIRALWEVGSEVVRITVPSQADADNLPNIRKRMDDLGIKVPLVADIHFTPQVALKAVEYVEKIRINPGNFADKKKFETFEYTDAEYQEELERIEEVFTPLVIRAKELGVSMRIGTNHGSLSDRIMNRYGDTPLGMVESALEFIRIAESNSYYDIVVSMKSSNPQTMVQAYRLLVSRFYELGMEYPLHLGVTEAGDGTDGRIKSSAGIGSLLEDGLGDTIRVSLTEDPVEEIPVAKALVAKYNHLRILSNNEKDYEEFRDPYVYSKFYSRPIILGDLGLGEDHPVRVEVPLLNGHSLEDLPILFKEARITFRDIDCFYFQFSKMEDLVFVSNAKKRKSLDRPVCFELETNLLADWESLSEEIFGFQKWILPLKFLRSASLDFWKLIQNFCKGERALELIVNEEDLIDLQDFLPLLHEHSIKALFSASKLDVYFYRKLAFHLKDSDFPIVLLGNFKNFDEALYEASVTMGSLLLDGIGDSIRISGISTLDSFRLGFDILQATRLRLSKTEYISCPSCGRTQFDLQTTTARIKEKTGHLKGVKIAVMGCIVNGPGEMADADFGYVGAGVGRVHLYKGKEIVKKGVPEKEASDALVELIKENGMWIEPLE